jgi:polyisoprenoid-binding protein YceI
MNVSWSTSAAVSASGGRLRMPPKTHRAAKVMLSLAASSLAWAASVSARPQAIDIRKSVMTVHVGKAGLFSAFGHDHDIAAPISAGSADTAHVELHIQSRALRVRDSRASEKERDEIQRTMLGPEVLDVERHPEIVFRSTAVEPAGPDSWRVRGTLTLHGRTRPVTVQVTERAGHYVGNSLLKQTDFGIKPIRIAGGTVRVKDEIRIHFDIQLAR